MDKTVIIGGGFSALSSKILINEPHIIITPCNEDLFCYKPLKRRRSLEKNKLLRPFAKSFGTLDFKLPKAKIHDRLQIGGNSEIWGGLIDLKTIPEAIIKKFKLHNINFKKLSYKNTGSISNDKHIYQISENENILNAKSYFYKTIDGYLLSFYVKNKKIKLNILLQSKDNKIIMKTLYTRKLILCTGVVQTLDLFLRSGLIKNKDKITLQEFQFKLGISFGNKKIQASNNSSEIRYKLHAAVSHFLGLQKKFKYSFLLDWIPIYIKQSFVNKKIKFSFYIDQNIALSKSVNKKLKFSEVFGASIHYCDMKVNNININKVIKKIHPNIIGIGMAFVSQEKPGPITNNIILDAYKKII